LIELAKKRRIAIEWQLPAELPAIVGDRSMIRAAFEQLLHNALVFTPESGRVTVRSYLRDDHMVIEVEDTGIGIAPEQQPYVFDQFFKVDPARTSNESETGLGLTIVKLIMEMHYGKVTLVSVPGQGSTFRLAFPVA
jgi:signal transduction histidine kinase